MSFSKFSTHCEDSLFGETLILFLYIDLVSIQKEIGETKIRDRGPKTQIFGFITQPPYITPTPSLMTHFFSLKWSFTKVLVTKKIEFGALVSGSEMSKFGSWNVTKYCAQGRDLPNKNEIYALVSWWDMSNFVGSWNLTKHCVNCFLALVSDLQNFISSPCIWRMI